MTSEDFATIVNPLARHGLTMAAGALAAHGLTGAADTLSSFAAAGLAAAVALVWSFAEKNTTVAAVVAAAPASEIEALANTVGLFRKQGASPLLVVHLAQVLTALATSELPVVAEAIVGSPLVAPAAAPFSVLLSEAAAAPTSGENAYDMPAAAPTKIGSITPSTLGEHIYVVPPAAPSGPFQAAETHGDMA